jgi:hypothetical protein
MQRPLLCWASSRQLLGHMCRHLLGQARRNGIG